MNIKRIILIIVLILLLIVGGSSALSALSHSIISSNDLTTAENHAQNTEDSEGEDKEYSPAPEFTVYDAKGTAYGLEQFIGKPTILNFWASWCGPCRMEMPDFNDKYLELGSEINFVMINMTDGSKETIETAAEFISSSGYSFPVYYDTEMDAAMKYGAYSLPTSFFIDAEGYVIAQATGAISAETLQRGIDLIY